MGDLHPGTRLLPLACCAAIQFGCNGLMEKAQVVGRVLDHSGAPVEGATVKVLKSSYTATTGPDGTYAIEFAPGSFEVHYSKDGYTSHSLDLDIQSQVEFPAEDVSLFPKPSTPGLHILTDAGLSQLEAVPMESQQVSNGWYAPQSKVFCTGEGQQVLPAGEVQIIDTSPDTLLPAKLGGYGLVFKPKSVSDDTEAYNGIFKDEKSRVGGEGLTLRSMTLEPGQYAYVSFSADRSGELDLDPKKPCYPFKVQ